MNKQIKPEFMGPAIKAGPGTYLRRRVAAAPSPAVAGFRPAGIALAVAAAFMGASNAFGQPSGATAVQGQALLQQQGNSLVVKTLNAAGTNRSVINWQSFSVPAGSTTRFDQPTTQSLSINRVTGTDPSSIFGTLSSNGRLVLVNPAGIAVGAGAVVDTAGFTASTLRMSDADALAGRLVFGDGSAAGPLSVNGNIVARSGDVVLIATNMQVGQQALVQAPNGATLLAAGQKVEITGRGLEGIVMQVQAPENEAVNLGRLEGNAVGVFAGTLKHSGVINANAVTTEGGKVVLKASGDNLVDGTVVAKAGSRGGSVDVLGNQVALFNNASIDVSGADGGGSVRVGGDMHGDNAAVQNARATFVGADAKINADATGAGDGGRVIVWADDTTRFWGQISARGGANGGNGGFAETSGKQSLDFKGGADLRAPQGAAGTLLLDPSNLTIKDGSTSAGATSGNVSLGPAPTPIPYTFTAADNNTSTVSNVDIQNQLANGNVAVRTSFSPISDGSGNITVAAPLAWANANELILEAGGSVLVNNTISAPSGLLALSAFGGTITQTAAIEANRLMTQSLNATTLNNSGNKIGTLAASAGGLSVTNSTSLTVGNIFSNAIGSLDGVDGGTNGNVNITVSSGDLTVNSPVKSDGGRVNLIANSGNIYSGTSGGVAGGSVILNASSGSINLSGLVKTDGALGSAGAANDGSVTMTARGISFDSIDASNYSQSTAIKGGKVMLTATSMGISGGSISSFGGNASLGTGGTGGAVVLVANGDSGYVDVWDINTRGGYSSSSNGAGGTGGGVTITTASGSISANSINTYGYEGADWGNGAGGKGGDVTITSTSGGFVSLGSVNAMGGGAYGSAKGGDGGIIKVTSTNGSISAGGGLLLNSNELSSAGGSSDNGIAGKGGAITLTANVIIVDAIRSDGGSTNSGTTLGVGGAAGAVTIAGGDGTIINNIYASGGSSQDAKAGKGGDVSVNSSSGGFVSLGSVNARGGTAYGAGGGGDGGIIKVTSTNGSISVAGGSVTATDSNELDSSGGWAYGTGAGGKGGAVTLAASAIDVNSIRTQGGGSYSGNTTGIGGDAGAITITADDGSAWIGNVYGSGGTALAGNGGKGATVNMTSAGGADLTLQYAELFGGNSSLGNGGNGGTITMTTSGAISAGYYGLMTGGGSSTSLGTGGNGGNITLSGGFIESPINLTAWGGSGGFNATGNGGKGGNGGTIKIEQTSGDWTVSYASISSGGGYGGGSASLAQGAGGTGGSISLAAKDGALTLTNVSLGASGGYPNGTHGTVSTTGTDGVTVDGSAWFSGNWVNAGTFNVTGSAGVSGGGFFSNTGKVFLDGTAELSAYGGVLNQTGGTITASSGNVYANITTNAAGAFVTVASGATLNNTDSMDNSGTVNVLGTLSFSGTCAAILSCGGGVLTNLGTGVVGGTGTINVDLLDNFGKISPGDLTTAHSIGMLTVNGDVTLEPNSNLAIDIANIESYDQLSVSGYTSFSPISKDQVSTAAFTPPNIQISFVSGATGTAGDPFPNVISSAGGIDTSVTPNITGANGSLTGSFTATSFDLTAATSIPPPTSAPAPEPSPTPSPSPSPAPTPAPTPEPTATPAPTAAPTPAPTAAPTPAPTAAPTPAPTAAPTPAPTPAAGPPATPLVDKIIELLDGDHDVAQQIVAQLDTNPLTTFTNLVLQEEKKQEENKQPAADNVVANVCTK